MSIRRASKPYGSVPPRFGVLQGSVLDPFLFTLYTGPIGVICRRHGIDYQLYVLKFQCHQHQRSENGSEENTHMDDPT